MTVVVVVVVGALVACCKSAALRWGRVVTVTVARWSEQVTLLALAQAVLSRLLFALVRV